MTLSTASPAKFPEAVAAAIPGVIAAHARADRLSGLPERMTPIAADAEAVKAFIREFARA